MKCYKFEVYVLDFENYGLEDAVNALEQLDGFTVHAIHPQIKDIGEWDDNHPMNLRETNLSEYFDNLP